LRRARPTSWQALVHADLARVIRSHDFVASARRAFQIWDWRQRIINVLPDLDLFIRPVADLDLGVECLNRLPCTFTEERFEILISADAWAALLRDCVMRAQGNAATRDAMIEASLRRLAREAGREVDGTDPRIAEGLDLLKAAPAYVRDSGISFWANFNSWAARVCCRQLNMSRC
jgi:hypothetical protein